MPDIQGEGGLQCRSHLLQPRNQPRNPARTSSSSPETHCRCTGRLAVVCPRSEHLSASCSVSTRSTSSRGTVSFARCPCDCEQEADQSTFSPAGTLNAAAAAAAAAAAVACHGSHRGCVPRISHRGNDACLDPVPTNLLPVACRRSGRRRAVGGAGFGSPRRGHGLRVPQPVHGAEVADDGEVALHVGAQHQLDHEL